MDQVKQAAEAHQHYAKMADGLLSARTLPGKEVLLIDAPNQEEAALWASGDYAAR